MALCAACNTMFFRLDYESNICENCLINSPLLHLQNALWVPSCLNRSREKDTLVLFMRGKVRWIHSGESNSIAPLISLGCECMLSYASNNFQVFFIVSALICEYWMRLLQSWNMQKENFVERFSWILVRGSVWGSIWVRAFLTGPKLQIKNWWPLKWIGTKKSSTLNFSEKVCHCMTQNDLRLSCSNSPW